jgi:hypothetical protein
MGKYIEDCGGDREGRGNLGRLEGRWEDNIVRNLQDID